ncbi:MAG: hypothetical protein HYX65_07960 [Gemmatimonadetes bacterium]|nr:hypothetical protein [Gemmatimonadota bacterium]
MTSSQAPAGDPLGLGALADDPALRAQIEAGLREVTAEHVAEVMKKKEKGEKKEKHQKEGRKNDLLKLIHEYQRRCIEFADRKATFIVFGANAFASFLDRSKGLKDVRDIPMNEWTAKMISGEVAIVFLAAAGFCAMWVIVPRIARRVPRGAIYWEAIRKYPSQEEWVGAMADFTEEDTQRIVLKGIYDLAGINVRKYRVLQTATWIGAIGMGVALLHIAL